MRLKRFHISQQGDAGWFWQLLSSTGDVLCSSNVGKETPSECLDDIRHLAHIFRVADYTISGYKAPQS